MTTVFSDSHAPQHIVLAGISWSYYERTLEELGNQAIRVAFLDGMMELMSPLPKHEGIKKAIGNMIAVLAMERPIQIKSYGSTTFRREDKSAGSEPDECFYFGEINSVKNMTRFDPALHRAPDLWIEVDLFSPSVPREPIYSRLGVPEVWRYENGVLSIRLLSDDGTYRESDTSKCLPFVPIDEFAGFVPRMIAEDESLVLREFAGWVRSLG
jgi:Uma2 family endonuclease